jgi:hypothetical protein
VKAGSWFKYGEENTGGLLPCISIELTVNQSSSMLCTRWGGVLSTDRGRSTLPKSVELNSSGISARGLLDRLGRIGRRVLLSEVGCLICPLDLVVEILELIDKLSSAVRGVGTSGLVT